MKRLAQIQAHLHSMGELREVIGAMRALAGMRMQEAQHALPGIRSYTRTIVNAIADSLLLVRPSAPQSGDDRPHRALVLCLAEHGFVGAFNEHLIDAALEQLHRDDRLFVLGSRGASIVRERGREPDWFQPMASRCSAAPEAVNPLLLQLYRQIAEGNLHHVEVMFSRYRSGAAPTIECGRLLPLGDAALAGQPARQAPLHNLEAMALHEKLVAEYVFARLTEAVVESIASENAARFAAMASAYDNVSGKLDALSRDANQARQSEITTEILDLITGVQAVDERPTVHNR